MERMREDTIGVKPAYMFTGSFIYRKPCISYIHCRIPTPSLQSLASTRRLMENKPVVLVGWEGYGRYIGGRDKSWRGGVISEI